MKITAAEWIAWPTSIKAENFWQDADRLQIAVHRRIRNCHLSICPYCHHYYYCCCSCCCFGESFDDNNDFTVCYFADVSFVRAAALVFHFYVELRLNDETWIIIIWFPGIVCTERGIVAVQPVVGSSRGSFSFLQSDEVFGSIKPVPHDTLIAVIACRGYYNYFGTNFFPIPLAQMQSSCYEGWST